MSVWSTKEAKQAVAAVPGIQILDTQPGEDYTTQGFDIKVEGTDEKLWVRGFRTSSSPIPSDDNVEVEMVEVTTGLSNGSMPNDPILVVAHAQVQAALMKLGHSVVNSLEPYF